MMSTTTAEDESRFLHFGDIVSLFSEELSGFLRGGGIAEGGDVSLELLGDRETARDLRDNLFCIMVQHQYAAAKEHEDPGKRARDRRKSVMDMQPPDVEVSDALKQTLLHNVEREKRMNKQRQADKAGTRVHYGEIIQLMHVKSGHYVTAQAENKGGGEGYKTFLVPDGSESSWFKINPRFKVHHAGDHIYLGDKTTLMNVEVEGGLFANVSDGDQSAGEVNCSNKLSTSWKINIFTSHELTKESQNVIQFHDVARLFHAETDGYLSCMILAENVANPWEDIGAPEVFIKRAGDVDGEHVPDHTSLWRFEPTHHFKGGVLAYDMPFYLRSVSTGLLLGVVSQVVAPTKYHRTGTRLLPMNSNAPRYGAILSSEPDPLTHVFYLAPAVETTNTVVRFDRAINLVHRDSGCLLHSHGNVIRPPGTDVSVLGPHALEPEIMEIFPVNNQHEGTATAITMQPVDTWHVRDIEQILDAIPVIQKFIENVRTMTDTAANLITKRSTRALLGVFSSLTAFLNSASGESTGGDGRGIPNVFRQDLTRELQLIDILFVALEALPAKMAVELKAERKPLLARICSKLHALIRDCFRGHRENELYIARRNYMTIIVDKIGHSIGAEETLTTLLANNEELLELPGNRDLISHFIAMLLDQGPRASYIRFLTALCSFEGKQIISNQEAIMHQLLVHPRNQHLFFKLRVDEQGPIVRQWSHSDDDEEDNFRGHELYFHGMRDVLVSWEAPDNMHERWKDPLDEPFEMSLVDLVKPTAPRPSADTIDAIAASNTHTSALLVADYFIAQIELFTELCTGRSYNCIENVSRLLSFDLILTCMKDPNLPFPVRAAFTSLMTAVYVDRSPQQSVPCPRYARAYSDDGDITLPTCDDPVYLNLLQTFCSDYIRDTNAGMCAAETDKNKFMLSVLTMTKLLLDTGFYDTEEEVKELVDPLVTSLDGRNDTVELNESSCDQSKRYLESESSQLIMQAKMEMCEVILDLYDLGEDLRMTYILRRFKEKNNLECEDIGEIAVMDEARKLDVATLSDTPLVDILLDLLLYDNSELCDAALTLLVRHFAQRKSLLTSCAKVQLLVDKESVRLFEDIKKQLTFLRNSFEAYEVWGAAKFEQETFDKVLEALHDITDHCSSGGVPSVHVQTLLRFGHAVDAIMCGLLEITWGPGGEEHGEVADMYHERKLFRACYEFLVAFMKDNATNQSEVAPHVMHYVKHIPRDVGSEDAVAAVYEGNTDLVSAVPTSLIRQILLMNEEHGPSASYVRLLRCFVICNGMPVRRNQLKVVTLMTSARFEDTLILCAKPGDAEYEKLIEWMAEANDDEMHDHLAYYIALLSLFAACAVGRHRAVEAKLQQLYPLPSLASAITDARTILGARAALCSFLVNVCLDSEVVISSLSTHDSIWSILLFLSSCTAGIAWESPLETSAAHMKEQVRFFAQQVLPIIDCFYNKFYDADEVLQTHKEQTLELHNQICRAAASSFLQGEDEVKLQRCLSALRIAAGKEPLLDSTGPRGTSPGASEARTLAISMSRPPPSRQPSEPSVPDRYMAAITRCMESEDLQRAIEDELWSFVVHLKLGNHERAGEAAAASSKSAGISEADAARVCRKLVHQVINNVDAEHAQNNIAVMRLFTLVLTRPRLALEDNPESQKLRNKLIKAQNKLASYGVPEMVITVVSCSSVDEVTLAAVTLGSALLAECNVLVQRNMHTMFKKGGTHFFLKLSHWIAVRRERLITKCRLLSDDRPLSDAERAVVTSSASENEVEQVLRLLQWMCEGHNADMQNIMREQSSNKHSYDLLSEVVRLLGPVYKLLKITGTSSAAVQIFEFLTECVQGPCAANQELLAASQLMLISNHILSGTCANSDAEEHELKDAVFKTLLSLLERRSDKTIHQEMVSTLDPESLRNEVVKVHRALVAMESLSPEVAQAHEELEETLHEESHHVYTLVAKLAPHAPSFRANVDVTLLLDAEEEDAKEYQEAYEYFKQNMGCVEVMWEDTLERIYFPVPPMCRELSSQTRDNLVWNVSRVSPEAKLKDFMERVADIYWELKHDQYMQSYAFYRFVTQRRAVGLEELLFFLTVVINFILLIVMVAPPVEPDTPEAQDGRSWNEEVEYDDFAPPIFRYKSLNVVVVALGVAQGFVAAAVCLKYMVTRGYFSVTAARRLRDRPNIWGDVFAFLTEPYVAWHLFYLACAGLGASMNYYFFSFQMLDIVNKSETLRNVVRSVTRPRKQLGYTALLGTVLIYIFSVVCFFFFRARLGDTTASSLFFTFLAVLDTGLRSGEGIGLQGAEEGTKDWVLVMIFNLMFFFVIPIIILNIIFGVTIDTFSALREEYNAKVEDMNSCCFICNLTREALDQRGPGFVQHIKHEHSMWQYVKYTVFICEKDKMDYDGAEYYIAHLLQDNDISWFPVGRTFSMALANEGPQKIEVSTQFREALADVTAEQATARTILEQIREMQAAQDTANSIGGRQSWQTALHASPLRQPSRSASPMASKIATSKPSCKKKPPTAQERRLRRMSMRSLPNMMELCRDPPRIEEVAEEEIPHTLAPPTPLSPARTPAKGLGHPDGHGGGDVMSGLKVVMESALSALEKMQDSPRNQVHEERQGRQRAEASLEVVQMRASKAAMELVAVRADADRLATANRELRATNDALRAGSVGVELATEELKSENERLRKELEAVRAKSEETTSPKTPMGSVKRECGECTALRQMLSEVSSPGGGTPSPRGGPVSSSPSPTGRLPSPPGGMLGSPLMPSPLVSLKCNECASLRSARDALSLRCEQLAKDNAEMQNSAARRKQKFKLLRAEYLKLRNIVGEDT